MKPLGEVLLGARKRDVKPLTEPVTIPTGGGGIVIQLRAPAELIDDVVQQMSTQPSDPVVIDLVCDEHLSALNRAAEESGTELRLRILDPDGD